jgi:hypothetical protein
MFCNQALNVFQMTVNYFHHELYVNNLMIIYIKFVAKVSHCGISPTTFEYDALHNQSLFEFPSKRT